MIHFQKYNNISEGMMQNIASDGDIILFKGNTFMNKMQRFVTGSRFDHVAMLFRDPTGRIYILEATGADVFYDKTITKKGVTELAWNEFVRRKWHISYEAIVFRHLEFEHDSEKSRKLQEYIHVF